MSTLARPETRIVRFLGLVLPRAVLAALDAWSARIAVKRAERRRRAAP